MVCKREKGFHSESTEAPDQSVGPVRRTKQSSPTVPEFETRVSSGPVCMVRWYALRTSPVATQREEKVKNG